MIPTSGKITVTTATIENHMCPTIIVGRTADGSTVYVRCRWGRISVRLDQREPTPHGGAGGNTIMEKQIDPNGLQGWLNYDEIRANTSELIDWPVELTPKSYDTSESWLEI